MSGAARRGRPSHAAGLPAALLAATLAHGPAWAQESAPAPAVPGHAQVAPAGPPGGGEPVPSGLAGVKTTPSDAVNRANTELVAVLVRTTLVAVHQANLTGNYTVLHDIGAPDFQHRNSAADLSGVFAQLRALKLDLSRSVILDPQITRAQLTADRKLYVVGALASEPVPITFEMLFQPVDGVWRVFGVSIAPVGSLAENASLPRPALVRSDRHAASPAPRPQPRPAATTRRTPPARHKDEAATTP